MLTRSASLLLFLVGGFAAAQPAIEGRVTSDSEPVPFATVRVIGTTIGTAAGADGAYRLVLPRPGSYTLTVSAAGFEGTEEAVTVASSAAVRFDVDLAATTYESSAIVVTGTMQQVGVRESPVRVEVLPARFLETVPTVNVMDQIERVNGLYQQIDCGVCYTNNIRINGIEGPNTAVLIDGMPIMSSLAAVYGLNGISPMLIKQVEVVKGPMSTLYGSEALGGVINIITKDPRTAPRLSVNAFGTTHTELAGEFAVVPTRGRLATLVSGTVQHAPEFHDRNGDGFSDRVLDTRVALFGKADLADSNGFETASLAAKAYVEDRVNGVEAFLDNPDALRGSSEVYGESIVTHRFELLGHVKLRNDLTLQAAGSGHWQDSFYGDEAYIARQFNAFTQALWTPDLVGTAIGTHDVLVGVTLRFDRYDDDSGATGLYDDAGTLLENRPDDRVIPGVFVQDEVPVGPDIRVLGGLRVDYQEDHGLIPSPRAAMKWAPGRYTTARLNAGTGFRVVNLFTEDHAAYTGGRATVILEDLDPERSVSATASLQQIIPFGTSPLTLDLDAFWTQFSNKIEPNYSVPGEIRYANLDGSATTRGLALQAQQVLFGTRLRYTIGVTLLDVFVEEDGATRPLEFAADYQGTATVTWEAPADFVLDYTARLTGPMALPAYDPETHAAYEAATGSPLLAESPTYTVHDLQLMRDLRLANGSLAQVYVAVRNVFDYRQPSPLVGYYDGNPGFGDSFDTAYVYGPIEGRHLGAGVRVTLP
jgi:outer membrane receptor for ferrienterochelin and colicins